MIVVKARVLWCVLFAVLAFYEIPNLTGFSRTRLEFVDHGELIDTAIRHAYPELYANVAELRTDYSNFVPQVRYWGTWHWEFDNGLLEKLLGFTLYQVLLPDAIVFVDVDGKVDFSRGYACRPGTQDGGLLGVEDCRPFFPDLLEQGVIGTVQGGDPDYAPVLEMTVAWDTTSAGTFQRADHCFSAYLDTPPARELVVTPANDEPRHIRPGYGYYLVAMTEPRVHLIRRISKAQFERFKSCSAATREQWPDFYNIRWRR